MHARKISQIAESRRHLRRDSGALTYRRAKRKARKAGTKRERAFTRKRELFLVFMFLISQFYFLQSPLFEFSEVTVEGETKLSPTQIESSLGLADQATFWDVSRDTLEQNLLFMHRLESARVEFTFPGRVQVIVNERKPAYFGAFIGNTGDWYTVDADGVVLEPAKATVKHPRILLPYPMRPGASVRQSDLQVMRFFQDNLKGSLQEQVRAIKINTNGELAFRMRYGDNNIWVRLGRPEKLPYKLFLLQELMVKLEHEKSTVESIDLRYSAPVVKKNEPVAEEPPVEAEEA
ncbi:MAG: FtsQ-type POTRA domain-containing protein [Vulcanimicrobiota bacterium]